MKRCLFLVMFVLPAVILAQDVVRSLSADEKLAIKKITDDFRSRIPDLMKENNLECFALTLVDAHGALWMDGFGYVDEKRQIPVDVETIFSLQSSSKAFTATAVLSAVRDGLVDLDVPITKYVPLFTVNSRFEDHPETKMTLRHLLGHRAGFTHEAPLGNNFIASFPSFEAHVKSIQDTWLRYPVGEHHAYANLGLDLAGYILQVVSKQSFAAFMRQNVLKPLGMGKSSFDWATIRAEKNRAIGHWSRMDSIPLKFALIPSGGLYSCAKDMTAFIRFQLNNGKVEGQEILSEALLSTMRAPSFAQPGQEFGYGLGIRRYERKYAPYYEHAGGGFGFKSHMSWYPNLGVGIVALSNSMDQNLVHSLPREIIDAIDKVLNRPEPARRQSFAELEPISAIKESQVQRLLGNYVGRGSRKINITLENGVCSLSLGGTPQPLNFISETAAYVQWDGGSRDLFRFRLDGNARPLYVRHVLIGWHYDYKSGPTDPPGPDKMVWNAYVGIYDVKMNGEVLNQGKVHQKDGYLYFNDYRLEEYKPGLFFSEGGEAMDFRGPIPTWRNILLYKKP